MNQKIKNLRLDHLLFVDIETARREKVFTTNSPHYKTWAWKQRDRNTNEIPKEDDVIAAYYNKAALSPEWGKIICISVGYLLDGKIKTKSFVGEEKDILNDFVQMVKKSKRKLAGYNLISFDVPYIRKRFFINKLSNYLTERQGNDVYAKPWDLDESIFDLMVAWKGSGYANCSLDELAMCFGIKSSKSKLHGNEVSDYYHNGKIEDISAYCEEDVRVVAEIMKAWKEISNPEKNKSFENEDPFV